MSKRGRTVREILNSAYERDPPPSFLGRTATMTDDEWLAMNDRGRTVKDSEPLDLPRTQGPSQALIEGRKIFDSIVYQASEPKTLHRAPYMGPRFEPPTPSYMRRTKRFAMR